MEQLEQYDEPPTTPSTGRVPRTRIERAASLVEYALLVALIAVACLIAVQQLGEAGSENLQRSSSRVSVAGA